MKRFVVVALALAVSAPFAAPVPAVAASVPGTTCSVLPPDNVWNTDISTLPVNAHSAAWLTSTAATSGRLLHPDFGGPPYGIPYNVVGSAHPTANFDFLYWDESDPAVATQQPQGPYPYGSDLQVEGPTDSHLLTINRDTCTLYETAGTDYNGPHTGWSGAIFNLASDNLRPDGRTSADAAGLPIFPGLVRLDEVQAGAINHAIRFTVQQSDTSHLWPARHDAGSASDPNLPPMGARFRLKSSYDISGFNAPAQVVLTAMKHYGLIVADNGSNWYFQGTEDAGWNNEPYATMIAQLKTVPASAFEAVDESSLMIDPNSGQAAVHPPCSAVGATATPPASAAAGTVVSITATATGCPNPSPLYAFWVLAPGAATWQPAQAYSTTPTLSWTTAGKAPGVYRFSIWARDAQSPGTGSNSLGAWDVYTTLQYSVTTTACGGVTSSVVPAASAAVGAAVTLTATASGCANPLYEFWVLPPGSQVWQLARGYASSPSFAWPTAGKPAGKYSFSIWARDAAGVGAFGNALGRWDAYVATGYTLTSTPCTSVSVAATGSLTLTAGAAGCPNPSFEFWVLYPGSQTWLLAQGYSTSATLTWAITGKPKGTYHFSVWARDASSTGGYGNTLGRWDAYQAVVYALT